MRCSVRSNASRRTPDCLRMSRAFHRPAESPDVRHRTRAALVAALDRARSGARSAVHVADESRRLEAAGDRRARLLRLLGHRQPGHLAGAARERGGGRGGGAGGRIRELDAFLRRAAAPLLDETGLGLRLRFLSGGMSPAARLTAGKVLPERSGYYLGLRLVESYLAERGLASTVRAAAGEFRTADERALGIQSA